MTPPVSACRDDNVASSRVNESKLSRPSWGSPGRLLTGVRTKRYWKYWPSSRRSRLSGPEIENRGSNLLTNANPLPNPGIRLFGLKTHSSVPRLVRTCVTLVENRPYSAANGFDSTSTDSTAPLGSSRSKSPVDGSLRLALLICSAPVVGAPPLMRSRPVGTADDAREHGQQRLEVVARERLDIHLRARQHVADRHRLQALGRRVGRDDDLDALADERQSHLDEHLLCLAALHRERRRLAVGKPLADRLHQIAAGRHVGKRDLADRVADRARDRRHCGRRHVARRSPPGCAALRPQS